MPLKYERLTAILTTAMITITLDNAISNEESKALNNEIECRNERQLNGNTVESNNINLQYLSHERLTIQSDTSIEQHLKQPYQYQF